MGTLSSFIDKFGGWGKDAGQPDVMAEGDKPIK